MNLQVFILGAVRPSNVLHFMFTTSGDMPSFEEFSSSLGASPRTIFPLYSNVFVRHMHSSTKTADLCHHCSFLEDVPIEKYDIFIFLNDGVRGPFTRDSPQWLASVVAHLDERTPLFGIMMSCEREVHVQSWFFATHSSFIRDALSVMKTSCGVRSWDEAVSAEIEISQRALRLGFRISSAQPPFLAFDSIHESKLRAGDPALSSALLGCKNPLINTSHYDIFTLQFVKYGGEILRQHLYPRSIKAKIAEATWKQYGLREPAQCL